MLPPSILRLIALGTSSMKLYNVRPFGMGLFCSAWISQAISMGSRTIVSSLLSRWPLQCSAYWCSSECEVAGVISNLCVCTHVRRHMSTLYRPWSTLHVFLYCFPPYCLGQGFWLNLELTIWIDQVPVSSRDPPVSAFRSGEIMDAHSCALLFYVGYRDQNLVSMVVLLASPWLDDLPRPRTEPDFLLLAL